MAQQAASWFRKVGIFILGVGVVIIGIILLPLPGPGTLVILAGFWILSLEFEWAQKYQRAARAKLQQSYDRVKKRNREQ